MHTLKKNPTAYWPYGVVVYIVSLLSCLQYYLSMALGNVFQEGDFSDKPVSVNLEVVVKQAMEEYNKSHHFLN